MKEINRLTVQARNVALRRLTEAHPEEYRALYNEEATARGVTVKGSRAQQRAGKIERLRRLADEAEAGS